MFEVVTRRPCVMLASLAIACSIPTGGLASQIDLDERAAHEPDQVFTKCATVLTEWDAARAVEMEEAGAYTWAEGGREELLYVRTAVHIVRTDGGEGGLSEEQLAIALDKANEDFAVANIRLIQTGSIDYIDSDAFYYDINTTQEINQLRSTNVVENAMNLYFTENLANENGSFCGISSFSWNPVQGIVMMNACTVTYWNPSTFSHEIGHYFDLLHTHETAYGMECVDGSNCLSAGDRLCDTPADPGLSRCGPGGNEYCIDSYCNYTGDFLDPCRQEPYHPATDNMMSYSRPLCRDWFTRDQCDKADATLINIRTDHLIDPAGVGEQDRIDLLEAGGPRLVGPNPNPTLREVGYSIHLPHAAWARVTIMDVTGRLVETLIDRELPAGRSDFRWRSNARLARGIYLLNLDVVGQRESHGFVLVR